jgi:hypothetical protein
MRKVIPIIVLCMLTLCIAGCTQSSDSKALLAYSIGGYWKEQSGSTLEIYDSGSNSGEIYAKLMTADGTCSDHGNWKEVTPEGKQPRRIFKINWTSVQCSSLTDQMFSGNMNLYYNEMDLNMKGNEPVIIWMYEFHRNKK